MGNRIVGAIVTIAFFALIAIVGYRLYQDNKGQQEASTPPAAEESSEAAAPPAAPEQQQDAGQDAGQDEAPAAQNETAGNEAGAEIPSFDVVRVEKTGDAVIAGRAAPGWKVEVESDGEKIGEAVTDESGQWTIVLDQPLARKDHNLALRATSPDGQSSLTSQQSVVVTIDDEEAVVALSEPGKAPKILQEEVDEESAAAESEAASSSETETAADETAGQRAGAEAQDDEAASREEVASAPRDPSQPEPIMYPDRQKKDEDKAETPSATVSGSEQTAEGEQRQANSKLPTGQPEPIMYPDRQKKDEAESAASDASGSDGEERQAAAQEAVPGQPEPVMHPDRQKNGAQQDSQTAATDSVEATTPGLESPEPPEPPVRIKTVDYQDKGESGEIVVGGISNKPSTSILLYLDGVLIGQTKTADDGSWKMTAKVHLDPGDRQLRVDLVDLDKDTILAQAAVGMRRVEPEAVAAAKREEEQQSAQGQDAAGASGDEDAGEVASLDAEGEPVAEPSADQTKVYTVQRGDTLWDIAEQYFGGGWRYTMIFRDNRNKIRNPNLIYPEQEFQIRPEGQN